MQYTSSQFACMRIIHVRCVHSCKRWMDDGKRKQSNQCEHISHLFIYRHMMHDLIADRKKIIIIASLSIALANTKPAPSTTPNYVPPLVHKCLPLITLPVGLESGRSSLVFSIPSKVRIRSGLWNSRGLFLFLFFR